MMTVMMLRRRRWRKGVRLKATVRRSYASKACKPAVFAAVSRRCCCWLAQITQLQARCTQRYDGTWLGVLGQNAVVSFEELG
jgi:hypothetical protein